MSELTSLPSAARRACVPVLTPVWAADADPLMIQPGRPLLCGSGDSCELQVLLAGVQKQHCELESRRGVLVITRVMASVWVNDIPASAGTAVQPGDRVAIGSATFRSELLDYEDCTPHAAFTPFGYRPASAGATASSDSGIPHSEQLQEWHDALQQRSNHLSEQAKLLESRFARLLQNQAEYDQRAHELEEAREALRLERDEIAAKHARAQEQLKLSLIHI